jgi:hypothetical protein
LPAEEGDDDGFILTEKEGEKQEFGVPSERELDEAIGGSVEAVRKNDKGYVWKLVGFMCIVLGISVTCRSISSSHFTAPASTTAAHGVPSNVDHGNTKHIIVADWKMDLVKQQDNKVLNLGGKSTKLGSKSLMPSMAPSPASPEEIGSVLVAPPPDIKPIPIPSRLDVNASEILTLNKPFVAAHTREGAPLPASAFEAVSQASVDLITISKPVVATIPSNGFVPVTSISNGNPLVERTMQNVYVPARALIPFAAPKKPVAKRVQYIPVPSVTTAGDVHRLLNYNWTQNKIQASILPSPTIRHDLSAKNEIKATHLTNLTFSDYVATHDHVFVAFAHQYHLVESGTCESHGLEPILNQQDCQNVQGRLWLYKNETVQYAYPKNDFSHGRFSDVPDGCSLRGFGDDLFFGTLGTCIIGAPTPKWIHIDQKARCECNPMNRCICNEKDSPLATWDSFAQAANELPVSVAIVDCTRYHDVCTDEGLKTSPSFRWYSNGKSSHYDFNKKLTNENLVTFAKKQIRLWERMLAAKNAMSEAKKTYLLSMSHQRNPVNVAKPDGEMIETVVKAARKPRLLAQKPTSVPGEATKDPSLGEDNDGLLWSQREFKSFLKQHRDAVVLFYYPGSLFEETFAPVWNSFTEVVWQQGTSLRTAAVECMTNSHLCAQQDIGTNPTIRWFRRANVLSDLGGNWRLKDILEFSGKRFMDERDFAKVSTENREQRRRQFGQIQGSQSGARKEACCCCPQRCTKLHGLPGVKDDLTLCATKNTSQKRSRGGSSSFSFNCNDT